MNFKSDLAEINTDEINSPFEGNVEVEGITYYVIGNAFTFETDVHETGIDTDTLLYIDSIHSGEEADVLEESDELEQKIINQLLEQTFAV
mgnify:CR=1 FL=1